MLSPPPTLSDGVTMLDPPRQDDAAAIVAAEDDAIRWAWDARAPVTLAGARRKIEAANRLWLTGAPDWRLAIRAVGDSALIGWIRLHRRHDGGAVMDLWIAPAHRRAGHALRAVRLMCRYGFETQALPWIGVEIKPANSDSMALAVAAGMEPNAQGVIRNEAGIFLTRYWITAERWQRLSKSS